MTASSDTTPAQDTHAFVLDEEVLLFQARLGRIFRLNPTASVIWQGLSAGIPIPEIIRVLVQSTGADADRITADLGHLILQWRDFGLFQGTAAASAQPPEDDSAPPHAIQYDKDETILSPKSLDFRLFFRILDTDFIVEVPAPDILSLAENLLSHLEITEPAENFIRFSVIPTKTRYLLLKDGAFLDWCLRKNGITPMIHANALMTAYDQAECVIGVHSAAVEINGRCILMPALEGSGKSTLTAALVSAGCRYLADDLVPLTAAPVRMRPVPVAIGLKEGAWSVLAADLPAIATLSSHRRVDEKLVRYFVPHNKKSYLEFEPRPVHALVFPKYAKDTAIIFRQISRAEALFRITEAGYDAHSGLTLDVMVQLIDWIATIPCFELSFSHLEEAVKVMQMKIG
jgi:Coenzyme PQQ synthesis protein D (PqqD)